VPLPEQFIETRKFPVSQIRLNASRKELRDYKLYCAQYLINLIYTTPDIIARDHNDRKLVLNVVVGEEEQEQKQEEKQEEEQEIE
jgi:hypothetical protein